MTVLGAQYASLSGRSSGCASALAAVLHFSELFWEEVEGSSRPGLLLAGEVHFPAAEKCLASAMTWKASAGLHLVASSRMRVPFGYSQSSPDTSATTSRIVPVNLMSSYEPAAGSVAEPAAGA